MKLLFLFVLLFAMVPAQQDELSTSAPKSKTQLPGSGPYDLPCLCLNPTFHNNQCSGKGQFAVGEFCLVANENFYGNSNAQCGEGCLVVGQKCLCILVQNPFFHGTGLAKNPDFYNDTAINNGK